MLAPSPCAPSTPSSSSTRPTRPRPTRHTRRSTGISFKTQLLYVVVFLCRYVDLFTTPHYSLYNTVMKLFFIGSSVYTLYLIKVKFR